MAQFLLELPQELRERIETRSGAANQKPENFMLMAIEQYLEDLEDLEDYEGAVRISEEVRSGRMKTYSLEEVRAHLGLDD